MIYLNTKKYTTAYKTLLLLFISMPIIASAQQNDTIMRGSIKGKVKDSVYRFIMNSATIAVYKESDSTLLHFTMPNNFGEFSIERLPVETSLKLIVTHIGYKPFTKLIYLKKDNPIYDCDWIYMYQNDSINAGKDVVVTAMAPVRMNGDTVEFNADAFRLDSNATAEDLLRKLPGFTVWGDGDITFNGKKINQLLVDGKPFLGGTDITAATQNLPKDALDKVQVYQQRNEKNPLDSTMFANLKLKEDKKMGYFGKTSAGYGTDRHYATDAMFTGFNKKMQISIAASANDVNKIASNMDVLIKNASYKGIGANTDYQPDFTMSGINKTIAGGTKFQYDFIPDPKYQDQSRLNADYFFSRSNSLNINNTTTNQYISMDSLLSTVNNSTNNNINTQHNLNTTYVFSTQQSDLKLNSSLSTGNTITNGNSSLTQKDETNILSTNTDQNNDYNRSNNVKLSAEYTHSLPLIGKQPRVSSAFTVRYSFSLSNNSGNGRTISSFHSVVVDSIIDKLYNRLYSKKSNQSFNQTIYAQYPDLMSLFFGRARMGGIKLIIDNTLNLNSGNGDNRVLDMDTLTREYQLNNYLTNHRHLSVVDENPSFTISKYFDKTLTNRYDKSLSIDLNLKEQYYRFHHIATQSIQNISYDYQKFIPSLSISYYNHQFGEYEIHSDITYQQKANYPQISRMAPLIDSTNLLYIPMGNTNLKPELEKNFIFSFKINSRTPKNPWEISLNTSYSLTRDAMVDSTIYNDAGQSIVYSVNMNSEKNYNGNAYYRKAIETKNNTYTMLFNYSYYYYLSPGYVNNSLNTAKSINNDFQANLDYSYMDILTLHAEQSLAFYKSEQRGFADSKFNNNNMYTRFSSALQLPKNLAWSTNVTYNRNASNGGKTVNYTIWNATITYRFLHNNEGEIKFSALDLLHQNKGVINKTVGNLQTIGNNNVLQQYFMLTLSYFPRKFGKK